MKNFILLFLVLFTLQVNAQSYFTRIYNQDTTGLSDYFYGMCPEIQTTADGGHLLHYFIGCPGSDDDIVYRYPLLIKTDSAFIPQWQKKSLSGVALKDSSIFTLNYSNDTGIVFAKRDLYGNAVWTKCLNTSGTLRADPPIYANSKIRLGGDCLYCSESGYSGPLVIDIDSLGNLVDADTLAGDSTSFEHLFTDDSGNYYFVFAGFLGGGGSIAKLRPDNTLVWSYGLHEANILNTNFDISCMVSLPNGGVIFGGNYASVYDSDKMILVKLSATGSLIWQKSANSFSMVTGMKLIANSNIVIAAGNKPFSAYNNFLEDDILEIDTAANVLWAKNIVPDSTTWPFYTGLSVPFCKNNNEWYFSAVTRNPYAAAVFSTDSMGVGRCASDAVSFSFYDTSFFRLTPVALNFSPIILNLSDYPFPDSVQSQFYVDSCDYALPSKVNVTPLIQELVLYPNPATNDLYISSTTDIDRVELFDIAGKLIYTIQKQVPDCKIDIHLLKTGNYIIKITGENSIPVYKKLVVIN